jgi:membrane-bound serine protease (ClpP class)
MRSRVRRLMALACIAGGILVMAGEASGASPSLAEERAPAGGVSPPAASDDQRNGIDVVKVDGLIDPSNASLIHGSISDANERDATMLVLQINSGGAVDVDVDSLVRDVERSKVPVIAWVGPSGADSRGAATLLVEASAVASVSSGSSIGPASPVSLDATGVPPRAEVRRELRALAERHGRDPAGAARLTTEKLSADDARRAGAIDRVAPTVGELIVSLDGREVASGGETRTLDTAKVIGQGVDRRRQPNQEVRFIRLDLGGQLLHTLGNPSIAYLLFVAGLALIVFEFYTCGIGLAGLVGAVAMICGLVGYSHLPVHWWAIGLLMLSVFGFAVDVQAGGLGAWTIIGSLALVAGSLTLYGGSSRLNPPWWVLLIVVVGTALFMLGAMTAVVRSRFSTPTVGREGMLGELGEAEVDVNPDGVVLISGARWRASTNRATPIPAGDPVRVVAVEGLVLEVEPEEGGAEDYRERAKRRRRKD